MPSTDISVVLSGQDIVYYQRKLQIFIFEKLEQVNIRQSSLGNDFKLTNNWSRQPESYSLTGVKMDVGSWFSQLSSSLLSFRRFAIARLTLSLLRLCLSESWWLVRRQKQTGEDQTGQQAAPAPNISPCTSVLNAVMEVRLPEHAARLVPRKTERTPAGAGGSLSDCFLKFTSISSLFLWPLPTPLWSWTQPQGLSVVKWHLPAAQRGPQINTQSRALFTFEQEKQAGNMRMHTSASFCCHLSPYFFLLSLSFMNAPGGPRSCPRRC